MSAHRELETKYAPADDAQPPDWLAVDGVHEVRPHPPVELVAVYFDTPDLRLLRAGVTLRRREGGTDAGWHVKVPDDDARAEFSWPLGLAVATPPAAARELVAGWTRGAALSVVASMTTTRQVRLLVDERGETLAEFADDRVVAGTPDGESVSWREWEVELVGGDPSLLATADRRLAEQGVVRADAPSKLARVLGDELGPQQRLRRPQAGKPVSRLVQSRLAELVGDLSRWDVLARLGTDEGVHQMRVACRRLRALLASSRTVLDRDAVDPVRDELRWLAGVLGEARDAAVVHERLRRLAEQEPRSLVQGPVLRRLRATYHGRGKAEVRAALGSSRYFALRDRLDALVAEPPWTELAAAPAREVLPQMLRKDLDRVRKRTKSATSEEQVQQALHEVRKAAKRLRYTAELAQPVAGKAARRLASTARTTTSHLGDLQDTVIVRADLEATAEAAAAAGEPTFTYGRLHRREEERARDLTDRFDARATRSALTSRTDKVVRTLRRS